MVVKYFGKDRLEHLELLLEEQDLLVLLSEPESGSDGPRGICWSVMSVLW